MSEAVKKINVLHVLSRLDRGGVETWMRDICLNLNCSSLAIDFLLMKAGEGAYDNVIRDAGCELHKISLNKKNAWRFGIQLYRLLKNGRYSVVHSHVHLFSGFILFIAWLAGIKCRISQSHTDSRIKNKNARGLRKGYIIFSKFLIYCFANKRIAVSPEAGIALYGNRAFSILKLGIDLRRYGQHNQDLRLQLLNQLQIPEQAFVIGHVGRFMEVKNHTFLIKVFSEVVKKNSNAYLLLIGNGPLFEAITAQVNELQLKDNVRMLGLRDDVPIFLDNILTVLAMPSIYEGSPVILLEAQAAGLPCVVSDGISQADRPVPELFTTLSLKESDLWVKAFLEIKSVDNYQRKAFYEKVVESDYNIVKGVLALEKLYTI